MSEALPELKHSDVIYQGRVFTITVDQVAYPDGRVVKMECVRHRGSVVLLPMTAPDRILLVRQYRYVVDRWLWELPAGTLEPNESLEAAALRECHEEVGKIAGHAREAAEPVSVARFLRRRDELLSADGFTRSPAWRSRASPGSGRDSEREGVLGERRRARWCRAGEICDMKTVVGMTLGVTGD